MSINLTDELIAKTKKGKIASAKQVFLEGDQENLQQIGDKTHQLENAVKDITVSGGASTSNAVSYNNEASGMTAVTAQGAIDELAAKNETKAEKAEVTAELEKKFDKKSVVNESGEAEDKVMSQKAVSDKLSDLSSKAEETSNEAEICFNGRFTFDSAKKQVSISNGRIINLVSKKTVPVEEKTIDFTLESGLIYAYVDSDYNFNIAESLENTTNIVLAIMSVGSSSKLLYSICVYNTIDNKLVEMQTLSNVVYDLKSKTSTNEKNITALSIKAEETSEKVKYIELQERHIVDKYNIFFKELYIIGIEETCFIKTIRRANNGSNYLVLTDGMKELTSEILLYDNTLCHFKNEIIEVYIIPQNLDKLSEISLSNNTDRNVGTIILGKCTSLESNPYIANFIQTLKYNVINEHGYINKYYSYDNFSDGYINCSKDTITIGKVLSHASFKCLTVEVFKNDIICLSAKGQDDANSYALCDYEGNVVEKSERNTTYGFNAPHNVIVKKTGYLIVNNNVNYKNTFVNIKRNVGSINGKAFCFGSSQSVEKTSTWFKDLCNYFNLNGISYGIGGATFARVPSRLSTAGDGCISGLIGKEDCVISEVDYAIENNEDSPDFIFIICGTNDAYAIQRWKTYYNSEENMIDDTCCKIGVFDDVMSKSLKEIKEAEDTSSYGLRTMLGSMRYCIETLKNKYKNATIIGVIPYQIGKTFTLSKDDTVYDQNICMSNIIPEIIKMYNIMSCPIINCFYESGIISAFEKEIPYRYTIDQIHIKHVDDLNLKGRALIGDFIISKFKKFFLL